MFTIHIYILHQTYIEKDIHIELSKHTKGGLTKTHLYYLMRPYDLSEVGYVQLSMKSGAYKLSE